MKRQVEIIKWDDGSYQPVVDQAVEEFPLTVVLDGRELVTLLCSPDALEELTVGFLAGEGLVQSNDDIAVLSVSGQTATVHTRGGCDAPTAQRLLYRPTITSGGGGASTLDIRDVARLTPVSTALSMVADMVVVLMGDFQKRAAVFKATGGTHASGLVHNGRIVAFYEDIGRHNAMDKILGHGLRTGVDFGRTIILYSGRVSSEVVLKAARVGVPVVVSKSAPTADAVETGNRLGVTVVGFVRGRRMNIYSRPERIRY